MKKLNQFDKKCFERAISMAREAYTKATFPVGAVLVIDNEIVDAAGNEIYTKKSFVNHAENNLIIKNGQLLAQAYGQRKTISLYSTLEPCVQCLGAAVTNHINKILYIEKDPNGGACDMKHDNIGLWYREVWPEIIHIPFSDEPKQLMIKFFQDEIKRGNTEWPEKMLKLFKTS